MVFMLQAHFTQNLVVFAFQSLSSPFECIVFGINSHCRSDSPLQVSYCFRQDHIYLLLFVCNVSNEHKCLCDGWFFWFYFCFIHQFLLFLIKLLDFISFCCIWSKAFYFFFAGFNRTQIVISLDHKHRLFTNYMPARVKLLRVFKRGSKHRAGNVQNLLLLFKFFALFIQSFHLNN